MDCLWLSTTSIQRQKTCEALAVRQQEDTIKGNTIFIVYVGAYSDVPDAADRDAQFELDSDKILL